jgi:cytochrome c-type protein NapC
MTPGAIPVGLIIITIALVVYVISRPAITVTMVGKVLAFLSLFILPILAALMGASAHVEHSKSTKFCLSCHEMEQYGKSLHIDDQEFIPASHYQNIRVPRDAACYTCHTDYTMFGGFKSKLRGLNHVYVHYLGTVPKKIELYTPYNNRECLHCHAGARTFEEGATHTSEEGQIAKMKSGELSCLSCHNMVHDVANLSKHTFWEEPKNAASHD